MKSTELGVVHLQQLLGIVYLNIRKFLTHYNSLIVINSLLLCWWWLCIKVFCKIHKRIRADVFFFLLLHTRSLILCFFAGGGSASRSFVRFTKEFGLMVSFSVASHSVLHANGIKSLVWLAGITQAGLRDKCSLIPVLLTTMTTDDALNFTSTPNEYQTY